MNDVNQTVVHEETLLGDLIKVCIDRIKELDRPWQNLSQSEQDRVIFAVDIAFRKAVKEACSIINNSAEKHIITAQVESVTFKDGIKAVLKVGSHDEGRHALADAEGENIQLIVCSVGDLLHDGGKPKSESDQGALPLDGDDD